MASASTTLSRRERQIMDVIYRLGRATVAEVRDELDDPPSYSAVRALLNILETKGHLRHQADGLRYVYQPTVPRDQARQRALMGVVRTFFDGSTARAMASLLNTRSKLTPEELDELSRMIERARREGK